MSENIWILCGKPENWNIALKDGIWGLTPKLKGKWKFLKEGDWLFFYANNPIAGLSDLERCKPNLSKISHFGPMKF